MTEAVKVLELQASLYDETLKNLTDQKRGKNLIKQLHICYQQWQIGGSCSGVAEDSGLLRCDIVSLGERFPTFWKSWCLHPEGWAVPKIQLQAVQLFLDHLILRLRHYNPTKCENCTLNITLLHPSRPEPSLSTRHSYVFVSTIPWCTGMTAVSYFIFWKHTAIILPENSQPLFTQTVSGDSKQHSAVCYSSLLWVGVCML
jgi:hypothetical protein